MTDPKKLLEELESLEGHVGSVQDLVKQAKAKLLGGQTLSKSEFDIVVEKIEKLDMVMRERRDVGH
jgi:hypothetical protein